MPAPLAPLDNILPLDVDGNFKKRNTQKQADAVAQFMIDEANQAERNAKGRTRTVDHIEEDIDASGTTIGKLQKAATSSPMELLGEKLDEPASAIRAGITANPDATGLDVAKQLLPNVSNLGPTGQAAAGFVAGAVVDPLNFLTPGAGAAKGAAKLIPKTPVAPTFYSPLQRFIASGKVGNSFTPDQLRGQLAKAGISESEIHWTGLEDALEGKTKVTKQEVLDHLAANEIQVHDIIMDDKPVKHGDVAPIDEDVQRAQDDYTTARQEWESDRRGFIENLSDDFELSDSAREAAYNDAKQDYQGTFPEDLKEGTVPGGLRITGDDTKGYTVTYKADSKEPSLYGTDHKIEDEHTLGHFDNYDDAEEAAWEHAQEHPDVQAAIQERSYDFEDSYRDGEYNDYEREALSNWDDEHPEPPPLDGVSSDRPQIARTKFGDPRLQLPGGTNYREVLLTLPASKKRIPFEEWFRQTHTSDLSEAPPGAVAVARRAYEAEGQRVHNPDNFTQGHFDEPNVMAHVRLTDRNIGGKKTLFVEEAQSDWDLLLRKHGVKADNTKRLEEIETQIAALEAKGKGATPEEKQQWADLMNERTPLLQGNGVADMPFKGKWHELAIKRVLRMAAEEGYDSVAWTTGKQQAERYNLQKHIKALSYKVDKDGSYHIVGTLPNGANQGLGQVSADKLTDTVGKDIAQRIKEGKGDVGEHPLDAEHGWKTLSDLDLKIGGEGKNKLYDEIIPSFLNKYGKRWDAKAGKANLNTEDAASRQLGIHQRRDGVFRLHDATGQAFGNRAFATREEAQAEAERLMNGTEQVHHFPIPDSLRKSVLEDGQSMFGSSFQAVHEFVKTLDPKQQQEIITALGGDNPPKWLKRLQGEEGGIQTAAAWLLTRMGLGFTAGALTADPERTIENGLIGAGLFSLASPKIVSQLASIVRKQQPNPAIHMNPQAAQAAGHTVSTVGHTPVDWDAVEANAAGAKKLIEGIADSHKANGGKRGHISVEETLATAKALGMHPDEFERWMSTNAGVAMNREQLTYGAMALEQSQTKNIPAKIAAYAKSGRVPGSKEDLALTNARLLHNEISKQLFGGREEAGGALQILGREPARSAIARENAMVSAADNAALTPGELPKGAQGPEAPQGTGLQTVSNDAYIKIWQSVEDKGALERSTRTAEQINGWDMLNELVYGDALSSPETHVMNALTSVGFNPVATAMIRMIASTKARMIGDTTGVVPGEASAILHGYYTGALGALKTVRDSYHEGGFLQLWEQLHNLEERGKLEGSGKKAITADNLSRILGKAYGHDIHVPYNKPYSFDPNGYIGKAVDIFGTAIRTPSQLLKVGDRFSSAVNFQMAAEAAAWRKAVQSGVTDEAELAALYQQNLARMPDDIKKEAEKFAKHEIFQEAITGRPGSLVEGLGHAMLRPLITFVRTPINVMKYNLEGVPLANRLVASVRADYRAGGTQAQLAQAKWILGGTFTGLAGILAYSGRLTGAGPEDPSVRKTWELEGYQQYSLNVGTEKKPVWLSYRWAEPFATWAGMAADAVYGWHHEAENVQSFIYGVLPTVAMNSFTFKTWTKDAMELFGAFKGQPGDTPDTKAARWEAYAKSRAKAFVPGASGLAAVTRAIDPVTHEAKTLWETLKKGIPILSSSLPPSYDLAGNVRMSNDLGPDIISPLKMKSQKPDKIAKVLWENGVGEPPFPKVIGGLEVTAKEKSQLQKLRATLKDDGDGLTLYQKLNEEMHTDEFLNPDLTKEGRKAILAPILHAYTNAAMAELGRTNSKFAGEREGLYKAHKKGYEKERPASDFELNP